MIFRSFDRTGKRWYPKVARAAEVRVAEVLVDGRIESLGEFAAEFDGSKSEPPLIVERFTSKDVLRVVRFATRDWSTVESSIPYAICQLASVVVAYSRNASLGQMFETAGVKVGPAAIEREQVDEDPYEHATVIINCSLSLEQFYSLVDHIERQLHLADSGVVSGTGYGIGGWSVDLSAALIQESIAIAGAELASRGIEFDVQMCQE